MSFENNLYRKKCLPDGCRSRNHLLSTLHRPAVCPQSRQPELKHAAVRIEAAELPWRLVALGWCDEPGALALRRELRALFDGAR